MPGHATLLGSTTPAFKAFTSAKAKSNRRGVTCGPASPTALLQQFFQRPTPSGFREKAVFKPSEMVQLGPHKVSPMGFGTWAWGNQLLWGYDQNMDAELQELFNLLVGSGINLFDTADSYGTGKLLGQSEKLLGKFIREYPGNDKFRNNIKIATKLAPYPWRLTAGQFAGACRGSAERLQQPKVAIGQLHWSVANYAPWQEKALWDGLLAMYDQGLVEAVGVSNYGPKQLYKIYKYLDKRGVPLASCQVQFSLLSRGTNQMATKAACDDLGVTLIAYSPLVLGLLSGKYSLDTLPKGPRGALFKQLLPGVQPLLEEMRVVATRRNKTLSQVAVNWCICQGTVPIPGGKSVAQARDNLGALGWRLSAGEVAALNAAADRAPKQMLQNIFQTN